MQIKATATERIVQVRGAPCRVWEGITEQGVRCLLLVRALVVGQHAPCADLESELTSINPLEVQGELENPNDRWTVTE